MRILDLGSVRVEVDGVVTPCAGTKQAALLTMLALRANQRVPLADLVIAGWGYDATVSSSTVENHMWRLRRLLEPDGPRGGSCLVNDAGGYRLTLTPDELDSLRFADLAEQARAAETAEAIGLCDRALALWCGTPYESIGHVTVTAAAAARLEEIRAQLLELRLESLLATGAVGQVLADVEPLLGEHPFREGLWGLRMTALARTGRVDEALQTYHRVRALLRDELGLEPGPALQAVQRQVMNRAAAPEPRPAPSQPAPATLPSRLGALIGRDREVREVAALVTAHSVVTVVGPGGAGKTRLAIQVARDQAPAFPDGVWFADLTEVTESRSVADLVLSLLGLAADGTDPRLQLRARLGGRRTLLVLDNCEHVLDGAAALVDDLVGTGATVLATSREPLVVDLESVVALAPLPIAAASELFRARAGVDDDPLVERICAAVDGLPLAVELAAARARSFTLAELVAQVEDDPTGLGRVGRGVADHHRTLRSAIEWSHRLLSADERIVHRRLSVLAGPFTLPVAAAVVGPDIDVAEIPTALAGLVHRSLLMSNPPSAPGGASRFRQLETIRAHARHELAASGELAETVDRRAHWALGLLRRRPRLGRPEESAWLDAVSSSYPTVRATLDHELTRPPDTSGLTAFAGLSWAWYYLGHAAEGAAWLSRRLVDVEPGPLTVTAEVAAAALLLMLGRGDDGRRRCTAALASLDRHAFPEGRRAELAEQLVAAATGAWACAPDLLDTVHRKLAAVVAPLRDPDLDAIADAVAVLVALGTGDSADLGSLAARSEAVHERGLELENATVQWISAAARNTIAVLTQDVDAGLSWTARLGELERGTGNGGSIPVYIELLADLLVIRAQPGDLVEAVRLYSAAAARHRLIGKEWPALAQTPPHLARVRAAVPPDRFDQAWANGAELARDDAALRRIVALGATDDDRLRPAPG